MTVRVHVTELINDDAVRITWSGIVAGDTCDAVGSLSEYDDRSVQVEGVFGSASIDIFGSLDGANDRALSDPAGTPLDFAVAKIRAVLEYVFSITPILNGGDGTTSLTVTLLAKRKRR